MSTTKIVWNGCDSYVEADEAASRGHDFDGTTLYHGAHSFTAIDAIQINPDDLPKDEGGEPIMDGVLGTETGRFYRTTTE